MRRLIAIMTIALACAAQAASGATGLSWKVQYDTEGRIARSLDPAGRPTTYTYEPAVGGPLKSLTQTPPEGAPVTWRFDDSGRPVSMADGAGNVAFRYDRSGQLISVARTGAPEIRYAYDTDGRVTDLRVGTFYHIGYTYDYLGRIAKVETPAGPITYDYQTGLNTVVRALPNGIKTYWKRQPNGELEQITHGFFSNPNSKRYSVLAEYTYEHGADGRISAIREVSGGDEAVRAFEYDTMGRLVHATGGSGKEYGYTYDMVGNRTNATATGRSDQACAYDWAGRMTSVNAIPCTYDASGNMTEVTLDGIEHTYRYQFDGRLAEAQSGGETVRYGYDGSGRLVSRKSGAGETRFIPDPVSPYWQPLVMEEAGGRRTLVVWDGVTPIALVRNRQVEWLLHDHLGSVRVVADAKGKVTRRCEYDPFGKPDAEDRIANTLPGFAGLFWDGEPAGYLAMARVLVPGLGGYLVADPVKRVPGATAEAASIYTYCGGDPVNLVDQSGAESTLPYVPDPFGRYIIYRVNNSFGTSDINDTILSHTFDVAYNTRTRKVERAYSFVNAGGMAPTGQGAWEDPLKEQNMKGGQAAVEARLGKDHRWTAKEVARGGPDLVMAIEFEFAARKVNPEEFNAWRGNICKTEVGHMLSAALTRERSINLAYEREDYQSRQFRTAGSEGGSALPSRSIQPAPTEFYRRQDGSYAPPSSRGERRAGGTLDPSEAKWRVTDSRLRKPTDDYPPPLPPPERRWGSGIGDQEWPPGGGGGGLRSDFSPSPVGGVYLGGSSAALEGLGSLQGVRLDANNNLVLVGEDGADIKMPPLRIDDVVTVFRSVYIYGEGPTVTIDPNPEDPEKSAMIIRHGKATEDTYVGWVLYEADRLMKGYTLGTDNITQKDVVSLVPGYADVLNTIYFGGGDPRKSQKEGVWERFWIVPAATQRFGGARGELTLFDVPLKVKTQKMKWQSNELVDDLTGTSSPGATAFTAWFTKNYEGIAAEQCLMPPAESGITTPVPVFTELRRVALLTAIAEKLRDQGVPIPFWMRDYEVRKVPFERLTPALEVTKTQERGDMNHIARIFGGVELSPETKMVKDFSNAEQIAKVPAEKRVAVDRSFKLAARLEKTIAASAPDVGAPPLTVRRVEDSGRSYKAVSVPGAETMALGPSRLEEVDIAVPLAGGGDIRLSRSFNSFFNPRGPWGAGWALDLPRLEEIRIPVSREGSKASYLTAYELITPLNSLYARFRDVRVVPELQNAKLQVPEEEGPFWGLADDHPDFLKPAATRVALRKDGQEWHFTERGDLVAIKDGPQTTVYERDGEGRVTRIVGLHGGALAAEIRLEYGSQGALVRAVGKSLEDGNAKAAEVTYAYAPTGRLAAVSSAEGKVGYEYKGPLVGAVTWTEAKPQAKPVTLRSFEYNGQGQVTVEKVGGTVLRRTINSVPSGIEASLAEGAGGAGNSSTRYDQRMRPVEAREPDGTQTNWNYKPNGDVETIVATPDAGKVTMIETAGGRKRTVRSDDSTQVTAQFDVAGRLVSLAEDKKVVMTQAWRPDGQLAGTETSCQGVTFDYGENALLSSIVLHPPRPKATKPNWQDSVRDFLQPSRTQTAAADWQQTMVDPKGNPVELKDSKGLDVVLGYDASGALTSAVQKTPEGNAGYQIKRDAAGRVLGVESSWGNTSYAYASDGNLQRAVTTRGDKSASVVLNGGRVGTVTGFDRGVTSFSYVDKGDLAGSLAGVVCANGLKLAHQYDKRGELESVAVGAERRVRLEYDAKGRVVGYAVEPMGL